MGDAGPGAGGGNRAGPGIAENVEEIDFLTTARLDPLVDPVPVESLFRKYAYMAKSRRMHFKR